MIHPELIQVWRNVDDIVQSPVSTIKHSPDVHYPTVDWSVVNKRFIQNIPTPTLLPILGCSNDPSFYEDVHERSDYGYHRNLGSKFTKDNPFGAISGYVTDAGVITVPKEVFHGHIYQDGVGWILHAEYKDPKPPEKKKQRMMKRRTKG